jgi:hypothetical protein
MELGGYDNACGGVLRSAGRGAPGVCARARCVGAGCGARFFWGDGGNGSDVGLGREAAGENSCMRVEKKTGKFEICRDGIGHSHRRGAVSAKKSVRRDTAHLSSVPHGGKSAPAESEKTPAENDSWRALQ